MCCEIDDFGSLQTHIISRQLFLLFHREKRAAALLLHIRKTQINLFCVVLRFIGRKTVSYGYSFHAELFLRMAFVLYGISHESEKP